MKSLRNTFERAFGKQTPAPVVVPFSDPEWKEYEGNVYRVVYGLQAKAGVTRQALRDFLSQEWIPALSGAKGCLGVELADNFTKDPMCVVIELWESRESHAIGGSKLVQVTHQKVFEKLQSLSDFALYWEGIVLEQHSC